ncbi:hypothetical protein ACERK3_07725 [Phycisphaerales bacterium AB-hyl4]|uniref:Nucleoside phosphorylase domain-containing protein n=1 Tax=Natronomicrosphaera hydrolytica TaxID=3242702 RepID=A0ABV4U3K8_9BACT
MSPRTPPTPPTEPTTLLLAATRPELLPTIERLGLRWRNKQYATGSAGRRHIIAGVTGVGVARALAVLKDAYAHHALTAVINLGFAGGLTPQWQAGDVAIIARVLNESHDTIELNPAGDATLLTLDRMVADVDEKRRFHETHHADMVDMETHGLARRVAELTTDLGQPITFAAFRAISDPVDVALPPEMINWVDARGRPRTTAAIAWLARNPHRLSMLTRLQRDTRRAAESLATAITAHLQ